MVNLTKFSKSEIADTGFKNRSVANKYLKDILKTKAQKYKTKEELIKVLKSEFKKFESFGIDLNEAHKLENKSRNIYNKVQNNNNESDRLTYDLTFEERKQQREERKQELKQERLNKKKERNIKKIQRYARKNFTREGEMKKENEIYIDGIKVIQAFYRGFKEAAIPHFINKYYKLPESKTYKESANKYKASFYIPWTGLEAFKKQIETIYNQEKNAFKINLSSSYILSKTVTEADYERGVYKTIGNILRIYHSSINNNAIFNHPLEVHDRTTLNKFINDAVEKIAKIKGVEVPTSEWKFEQYLHIEVVIFKTNLTIGNAISLPDHFYKGSNEKNIIKFDNYDDNLCFWRCIAAYNGIQEAEGKIRYTRFEKPAKNLYMSFYNVKYNESYKGIQYTPYNNYYNESTCDKYDRDIKIDEIDKAEEQFKFNIHVYTQDEEGHAEIDRRTAGKYDKDVYLLRYNNHFCLIKDIKHFIHSFRCRKCSKSFNGAFACSRHEKTCSELCKHVFPGGFCKQSLNIFEKLNKFNININNVHKFYDYFITYDFETILKKNEIIKTDCLTYTNTHIPVSFSIFSNIPGYNIEPIHEVNENPKTLINIFVQTLVKIAEVAYEENKIRYSKLLKSIDNKINSIQDKKEKAALLMIKNEFDKWMREVPTIGFNSAKYDCNIMKKYLYETLNRLNNRDENERKDHIQVLKTGNSYRVFTSKNLKFLDISNFLAAGTSLDKWLKAYKCEVQKAHFPYEWLDNYNKLYDNKLPDYNLWYSSLKNKNISDVEYNEAIELFNKNNMLNMFDYLKYYNNCDVIPMVEAINKMFDFYRAKGLDMFKDAISLPGLAYKMLMTCPNANFSLFEEEDKHLYYLLKNNIRGGPSIIFNRYQEVDKTLIRGDKVCKNIIGFDANALYLWAIMQEMPVGQYKHIKEYNLIQLEHDILNNKLFGFVEVDIKVPDELYNKFSEMSPIFKNIVIDSNDKNVIGEHMFNYCKDNKIPLHKGKKLIGSMFGEKILLYTPLLKWYLEHGLIITKFYEAIEYNKEICFKELGEQIADARRAGDADKSMEIIAETMKLIGNSLYGRCVMNKEKHIGMSHCDEIQLVKKINNPHFKNLEKISEDYYEVFSSKSKIKMDVPIQVGMAVYDLAKLRMLEFYYDFIDYYIDRSDFVYCQMDTDSAYIAFSSENFEELIKPELKEHYILNKYNWFPRDDTKEHAKFDKRTPGLFKKEYEGKSIVGLCPKMYFVEGAAHEDKKYKFSSKGIQKDKNDITMDRFKKVLNDTDYKDVCINKGFRVINNDMITYTQQKKGLSYYYDKRIVCDNGVDTLPLPI